LARFGQELPHHDARITHVRAFFIGAGPDQLDLVDCSLSGGGVLGESIESYGESGRSETEGLKGHQLGCERFANGLRRPAERSFVFKSNDELLTLAAVASNHHFGKVSAGA
jgi:hypothetical protein